MGVSFLTDSLKKGKISSERWELMMHQWLIIKIIHLPFSLCICFHQWFLKDIIMEKSNSSVGYVLGIVGLALMVRSSSFVHHPLPGGLAQMQTCVACINGLPCPQALGWCRLWEDPYGLLKDRRVRPGYQFPWLSPQGLTLNLKQRSKGPCLIFTTFNCL